MFCSPPGCCRQPRRLDAVHCLQHRHKRFTFSWGWLTARYSWMPPAFGSPRLEVGRRKKLWVPGAAHSPPCRVPIQRVSLSAVPASGLRAGPQSVRGEGVPSIPSLRLLRLSLPSRSNWSSRPPLLRARIFPFSFLVMCLSSFPSTLPCSLGGLCCPQRSGLHWVFLSTTTVELGDGLRVPSCCCGRGQCCRLSSCW